MIAFAFLGFACLHGMIAGFLEAMAPLPHREMAFAATQFDPVAMLREVG